MMKKPVLSFALLLLIFLTSCQEPTTFEEDVLKLGKLNCELMKEGFSGGDIEDLQEEGQEFLREMEEKYSSEIEWKAFSREVEKYMVESCE